MRPRLFSRGEVKRTALVTSLPMGFNEAAALQPRRGSCMRQAMPSCQSFNEAAALQPRRELLAASSIVADCLLQ